MDRETLTAQLDKMEQLYNETQKLKKVCKGLSTINNTGIVVYPMYFLDAVDEFGRWKYVKVMDDLYKLVGERNSVIYTAMVGIETLDRFLERQKHEDNK